MAVRRILRRATVAAAAGLAATGTVIAGAPAHAAPAALHVTATISLGPVGSKFSYEFSEALLLAYHYPGGKQFVDGYAGSTLRGVLSRRVSFAACDVAGTGAGLLMLQRGKVTRLSPRRDRDAQHRERGDAGTRAVGLGRHLQQPPGRAGPPGGLSSRRT